MDLNDLRVTLGKPLTREEFLAARQHGQGAPMIVQADQGNRAKLRAALAAKRATRTGQKSTPTHVVARAPGSGMDPDASPDPQGPSE